MAPKKDKLSSVFLNNMALRRGVKLFASGLALLGLLSLALRSGVAMDSDSGRQRVETLVKTEWGKIHATIPRTESIDEYVSWRYAISPPIPAAWPPDGKGTFCYYAFAYGLSPARLADGQLVAAPWARVKVDAKGKSAPQLELLRKDIQEVGIQGVRPLAQEEIAVLKQEPEVEANLLKLSQETSLPLVDTATIKSYFILWCATNGTIAGQLRPLHKDFFRWAGCK